MALGRLLDGVHEAVSRIHLPLMSSKSPVCCSPSLFPPSNNAPLDSVLWMGQKINEPLWKHLHSWGSWKIIHVLFPLQENSQAKISLGPKLCCLGGDSDVDKVKIFLLPSPMHPNSYLFFAPTVWWNLSTRNLDIHKGSP